jgi:hypothetical protein
MRSFTELMPVVNFYHHNSINRLSRIVYPISKAHALTITRDPTRLTPFNPIHSHNRYCIRYAALNAPVAVTLNFYYAFEPDRKPKEKLHSQKVLFLSASN